MRGLLFMVLSMLVWGVTQAQAQPQILGSNRVKQMVTRMAHQYMARRQVPGVAIDVIFNGKSYVLTYGVANRSSNEPIETNTLFEIGSITKVFTAMLLAIEVENHRVKLSDPVTRYLPKFVGAGGGAINRVTLQQLATFRSSLPRHLPQAAQASGESHKRQDLNYLVNWQPQWPIGSRALYSNLSYGILGYALEGATGQRYFNLLNANILKPLNMSQTFIVIPTSLLAQYAQGYNKGMPAERWWTTRVPAAGALRSSPLDMLSFLKATLGVMPLSSELGNAIKMTQTPYSITRRGQGQGLAWVIQTKQGMNIIEKNGSTKGFASYIGVVPDKKMGVVILANKFAPNTRLGRAILRRLSS